MKRFAEECCLLAFLLLLTCNKAAYDRPEESKPTTQTILWEQDEEGYLQFYTNDSQNLDVSFMAVHGSRCDPMGSVEAEVRKVSGSLMGAFGLAFCMQDEHKGYLLGIDIQGFYSVYKRDGDYWTPVVDWSYSDLLHTGYDTSNMLKVDCTSSPGRFSVFLNGSSAAAFVDASYTGGYYGYFVDVLSNSYERFPHHPVDVRFRSSLESGIKIAPTSGLVTTEAGGSATFTMALNGRPSSDVTIALWSSDETEGTVSPTTVTFTPDNWSAPQTVTVTGVDDLLDDEPRTYTIATLPAVSSDPAYNGLDAENISISNTDDDPPLAPGGLVATAVSGSQTDLTWSDNAANEEGFTIERKLGTNGPYAQIATLAANVTFFSDMGLTRAPNLIYSYRVRAFHGGGASPWSPVASTIRNITTSGGPVAIDGDYAVVGPTSTLAAARIFHRTGPNGWDSGAQVTASGSQTGDAIGASLVAISGDYIIVGAYQEDVGGADAGAAYIFHRTGLNSWDSGTKILAPDAEASDWFGRSVAISGDYAIVGAERKANGGAAYIFHRTGTNTWDSGTRLQTYPFSFGRSVAVDADYAVVGATLGYPGTGAAYIFHRTGVTAWDAGTKVVPADGAMNDFFGCSAAISGDYAIVGADSQDARGLDAGAAYIFHRTSVNSWDAGTKITGADSQAYDFFGRAVSIRGDYAVIGAEGEDQGGDYAGAIYIFHRTGLTSWDAGFQLYISPGLYGGFGRSVSTDGTRTIVAGYGAYVLY